jgi:hypothetical protein
MNKYLLYLKNPKIWGIILILIVVIVAIVSIIISLKPTPIPNSKFCGSSKIKTICPDKSIQCADICPEDQIWSCIAPGSSGGYGACVCRDGNFTPCNGKSECCAICVNDMCCDAKHQAIYRDETGKLVKKCCPPTTIPGITGDGCLSLCGTSPLPCPQGVLCMQIVGLTGSDFTDNVSNSKADGSYRSDDGSTLYVCPKPSECQFGISNIEIAPYHSTTGGLSSYYNVDNIMKDLNDNICIPSRRQDYGLTGSLCYSTDYQSLKTCTTDCTWASSFDIFSEEPDTLKEHMSAIMYNDNKSDLGYYCGKDDERLIQYKQSTSSSSGTCSWQDCLKQVEEPGVIRIRWDNTSQKCSTLQSTRDSGIRGSVQCTDNKKPCSSCIKAGDYANCVLCTGSGTPCQNCTKAGEYLDNCEKGFWKFTDCNPNGNDMVLRSFADTGKTCNQDQTSICGNCAWGGNDSSSIFDFGHLKAGRSQDNVYCVSDKQIRANIIPTPPPNCPKNYVLSNNNICVFPCTETGEDARLFKNNNNDADNEKLFTSVAGEDGKISCFRNIIPFTIAKDMCGHAQVTNYCIDNPDQDSLNWLIDNKYTKLTGCHAFSEAPGHDCIVQLKDTIQFNPPPVPDLPKYYFPKNGRDWNQSGEPWPYNGWPLNLWFEGKPSDNFFYGTNVPSGTFSAHPQLEDLGYDLSKYEYGKYPYITPP